MSLRNQLLTFIQKHSDPTGYLASYAVDEQGDSVENQLPTPYFALLAFSVLSDPLLTSAQLRLELTPLLKKFVLSLTKERSKLNTYNYWYRNSDADHQRHIPDDWDDTALAYSILYYFPDQEIARQYPLLKQSLLPETTLFQTWILPRPYPEKWQDLDVWVNLNICYWLIKEEVLIPPVWRQCCEALITQSGTSQYYLDYSSADFFFARTAVRILKRKDLSEADRTLTTQALHQATQRAIAFWEDSENLVIIRSWAALTLKLVGKPRQKREIMTISRQLLQNGHKIEPIILGWQQPGKRIYDASPAVTASLLLAALEEQEPQETLYPVQLTFSEYEEEIQRFMQLIMRSDFAQEVAGLPFEIGELLAATKKPMDKLQAKANALAWLYYWLDDQRIDNHELPFPTTLQATTVYLEFKKLQQQIISDPAFWQAFQETEKTYQKAATVEITNKPITNWQKHYSAKFSPYLLAIRATLTLHDQTQHLAAVQDIYHHYLLAKQWSDDSHDCLEDIRANRHTVCTDLLYPHLTKKVAAYSDQEIEALFLEHAAQPLTAFILEHITTARTSLEQFLGTQAVTTTLHRRISALEHRTRRLQLLRRDVASIQAVSTSKSTSDSRSSS